MKNLNTATPGNQVSPPGLAIPEMLSSLYAILTQLEQNQEILRDRLHPVLQVEMLEDGTGKECESNSQARSVPHAEQLEQITSRIDRLNNFTLDALNRLHV